MAPSRYAREAHWKWVYCIKVSLSACVTYCIPTWPSKLCSMSIPNPRGRTRRLPKQTGCLAQNKILCDSGDACTAGYCVLCSDAVQMVVGSRSSTKRTNFSREARAQSAWSKIGKRYVMPVGCQMKGEGCPQSLASAVRRQ
jgi:hypothetical protein